MKLRLRCGFFSLMSMVLIACESVPDEVRVLEKSRQVQPAWLASGTGLRPSAEGIDYVFCKDKVLDLPLGLVQTESSVLYNLKFQMYQLIISHIDSKVLSAQSARDLHEQIGKILDKALTKTNIKDIYFDRISVPRKESGLLPEYYRIFAFAHVEANQRSSIATDVKAFIKSYPAEDLRSQLNSISQF